MAWPLSRGAVNPFAAVILAAPFVDVLSTMLDKSLALTEHEHDEWGDPVASAEDFHSINIIAVKKEEKRTHIAIRAL